MKLSNETLSILKNYSTINQNLVVKPGNILRTISTGKNIYSESEIAETFDREFGIYDLGKFLATLSLFKNPDLTFNKNSITITDGNASIEYHYSEPSLLVNPPSGFKMPPSEISFELKAKDLSELNKACAVLQVPDLSIICDCSEKNLELQVHDKKDVTSNSYRLNLSNTLAFKKDTTTANLLVKTENLKFITDDYFVNVSKKNIAEFLSKNGKTKYYISLETSSNWNE